MRVDVEAETDSPVLATTILRLEWLRRDPLAVSLRLIREPAHPALVSGQWHMLRDFLRYGIEAPTGDGNVRLGPGERDTVVIDLRGEPGQARVSVPAEVIRQFLEASEQVVPAGAERSDEAIDALLEQLLGRAT